MLNVGNGWEAGLQTKFDIRSPVSESKDHFTTQQLAFLHELPLFYRWGNYNRSDHYKGGVPQSDEWFCRYTILFLSSSDAHIFCVPLAAIFVHNTYQHNGVDAKIFKTFTTKYLTRSGWRKCYPPLSIAYGTRQSKSFKAVVRVIYMIEKPN